MTQPAGAPAQDRKRRPIGTPPATGHSGTSPYPPTLAKLPALAPALALDFPPSLGRGHWSATTSSPRPPPRPDAARRWRRLPGPRKSPPPKADARRGRRRPSISRRGHHGTQPQGRQHHLWSWLTRTRSQLSLLTPPPHWSPARTEVSVARESCRSSRIPLSTPNGFPSPAESSSSADVLQLTPLISTAAPYATTGRKAFWTLTSGNGVGTPNCWTRIVQFTSQNEDQHR